jgi:hypothetical protein
MAEMLNLRRRGKRSSPMAILSNFPHFQCRDEKDHMFAMIGVFEAGLKKEKLFGPDHVLRSVSYNGDIAAVYTAMAQYHLSFDSDVANVELLSLSGAMKHAATPSAEPGTRIPSWVPDWRKTLATRTIQLSSRYEYSTYYPKGSKSARHTNREAPEGGLHAFALAWASLHMPFRFVHPCALQIHGLPIDTIDGTIHIDLFKHADRLRLQSWLDNGHFIDYYRTVSGSLLEAVSESLVYLCHTMFWGDHVTSWVQDNQRRLFDALDQKYGHDAPEFQEFLQALPEIMRGRCFIRTRLGYLEIGSRNTRPGDRLVLPVRSPILFILRDLVSKTVPRDGKEAVEGTSISRHALFGPYELIGDMYMHAFNFSSFNAFAPKPLLIF